MRLVTAAAVVSASIEEVHPALSLVMLILHGRDGQFPGLLEVLLQKRYQYSRGRASFGQGLVQVPYTNMSRCMWHSLSLSQSSSRCKVCKLQLVRFWVDQDVLGLDVAVHDVLLVQEQQCTRQLEHVDLHARRLHSHAVLR